MVHKYGGSSVADTSKLQIVAKNIAQHKSLGYQIVCVVSAMGNHTDTLTSKALELSEHPPQRELDMLLTAGERISMALLSIALNEIGVPTISLTGSQCGILTDNKHGNAKLIRITGERIKKGLSENSVVIVAGFQGVCPITKEITTLGRGGSDLSAVALAHSLKADYCLVYKDVEGICQAHPKHVPQAKVNREISFAELCSLTYYGSEVIHYRAARLAQNTKTRILIRPTMNPEAEGTIISDKIVETSRVVGVSHKQKLVRIQIPILINKIDEILDFIWSHGEQPTSCSHENDISSLIVTAELFGKLSKRFQNVQVTNKGLCSISIAGTGLLQQTELMKMFIQCLPSKVIWFGSSDSHATAVIQDHNIEQILQAMHQKFFAN